jgi:hypothetical protein
MSTQPNDESSLKKSKLEEVLRTEVDFYDRLGNHAILTKVIYRDKKGKFSEQVIRVQWVEFIDIKKLTYITSVSIAVNKCSNGVFFMTAVRNNHGDVSYPYESEDLENVIFDAHEVAAFYHQKPKPFTDDKWISKEKIKEAYKNIERLL